MGMLILTKDDTKYQTGKYLMMYRVLDVAPSLPDMTYILRTDKFTEQDILACLPIIQNRLVVCMKTMPRLSKATKDLILIDESKNNLPSLDIRHSTRLILKENDRLRAYAAAKRTPIPYALSFIRANVNDIGFYRRLANIGLDLADCYTHALMAFGIEPIKGRVEWPRKKKTEKEIPPPFRSSDKHWLAIIEGDVAVANNLRIQAKNKLPKGIKKTRQEQKKWL